MTKFDVSLYNNTLSENRKLLAPGNILIATRPYFAFNDNSEVVVLKQGDLFLVLEYYETILEEQILNRMQVSATVLIGESVLSLEMFFVENTAEPWKKVSYGSSTVLVPNLGGYFAIFYTPDDIDHVY